MTMLTYTAADFELPLYARSGHCPKCGGVLRDTGVRITRPDGVRLLVLECKKRVVVGTDGNAALYSEYEGTTNA